MLKNRSIVFINQATGYLTIDIINEFIKSPYFDRVALVSGSIRVQDILLDVSVEQAHIIKYNRGAPLKKLLSWLIGTVQILWLLLTRFRKYEIFYITIPPFAYLLSLILPNRFSVLVYDVYPDVLNTFNISSKNVLYRIWASWNRKLFRKCNNLFTIGDGMKSLLEQYTTKEKIVIIPNWTGLTRLKQIKKEDNRFLLQQSLENKFVVLYSGNIGVTHNIESLLEVANLLVKDETIFFLIIGRGERYEQIESKIAKLNLANCKILPFQPDEMLNEVLAAADLGVVLLNGKSTLTSVPSKLYNLQAVGVPILGIAGTDSDLNNHLNTFETGKCFEATDLKNITNFILKLKAESEYFRKLKDNSKLAASSFTGTNAKIYLETYVQIVG